MIFQLQIRGVVDHLYVNHSSQVIANPFPFIFVGAFPISKVRVLSFWVNPQRGRAHTGSQFFTF